MFTKGENVTVTSGKFAGTVGKVVETTVDKNDVQRVRVQVGTHVFSYLAKSLQTAPMAGTENAN